MLWMTWRQHRMALSATAVLFLALAGWLLVVGSQLRSAMSPEQLVDCVGVRYDCGPYLTTIATIDQLDETLLPLLPALVGIFLGAPMLSREIEQRTLRYTWAQGISRTHWLRTKILLLGASVLLVSSVFSAAYMWLYQPAVATRSWFDAFPMAFPVFPAMCLFGFALGVLAGTVFKHMLVGMGVVLVGFLAVLIPIAAMLRYYYMAPVQMPSDDYKVADHGMLVDIFYTAPSGAAMDLGAACVQAGLPCSPTGYSSTQMDQLRQAGFVETFAFQPGARFWPFQFIETGIFLWLTAACIALTFWLLRRKHI
ncbi:ABC transporter permease subunit [Saccharopolyspora sp. NPDC050389]|uniref:ABC transporter permease subunit n=1 Tax=Saccharopolyspora sp. NPDC050389 TaxID=3155516 RepID=UPI0033DA907F